MGTLLLSVGFIFVFYGFVCYMNYRIVTKFNPTVKFWENLIPGWNMYILARAVMNRPVLYMLLQILLFVVNVIVSFNVTSPAQKAEYDWLFSLLGLISAVLCAYLWGEVAYSLGKSRWLHRVLAFFAFPLIITIPMMAFDQSQPVRIADSSYSDSTV